MMALKVNNIYPGVLEPNTTVGGCIDIFENAWPNPEQTIAMVESAVENNDSGVNWERAGTIGDGINQDARTNMAMNISHNAEYLDNAAMQNIHNQFYMMIMASLIPYANRYGIHDQLYPEDFQMLKYSGGQQYKPHSDGGTSFVPRQVTAICYLNDNYEGGELEFPYFGIKLQPQKGMLVLFPSNFAYAHAALPVTEGVKYSLVTWMRDKNDNQQF
jgi:Rps23 Pro-64 3,4-dihydroxylase Tpa1-like proline 4-hydroxylase